jgi:Tol biopolymer transport system component
MTATALELLALPALLLALTPPALSPVPEAAERWTPPTLATDQYESSPTFTPDGMELYFVRSDPRFQGWRVLWSRCGASGWTAPEEVPFAAPPPVVEADPFVTADGRYLYFISTRSAPGKTGDDFDIWVVARQPDGAWGPPRHLPEPVNSPASELLPRVTTDGRIYFGSRRPGGFGLSDIYLATPGSDGAWRVENLGPPVSTADDEYEAEVSRDGSTLVVVADRGDNSHLYRFARQGDQWVERGRVPASSQVFQIGPLLSPTGDRLLFAQADGDRSGEIFLVDLVLESVDGWPPRCGPEGPAAGQP